MWKKQKGKRIFKSLICMVLAVVVFMADVPDLGMVLKVIAHPKPDQLTVIGGQADAGDFEKNTGKASGTSYELETGGTPEMEHGQIEPESFNAYSSGNENIEPELPEPELPESEMADDQGQRTYREPAAESTEDGLEDFSGSKNPEYVKTVISEDIVYDEIIDGDPSHA